MKQEILTGTVKAGIFPALHTLIFCLLTIANVTLAYITATYQFLLFSLVGPPLGYTTILVFFLTMAYDKVDHTLRLPKNPMMRKQTSVIHC